MIILTDGILTYRSRKVTIGAGLSLLETADGLAQLNAAQVGASNGVLDLQPTNSGSNRMIRFLDGLTPSAVETNWIFGRGPNSGAGGMELTPSTAAGGVSFTTPAMKFTTTLISALVPFNFSGTAPAHPVPTFGPVLPNTERGRWNLLYAAIAGGKPLYFDEEFASGLNGLTVYNNGTGNVTLTRSADASAPNASGFSVAVAYDGTGAPTPGVGGFILTITPRRNAVMVQRFRAKVPVGYTVNLAENAQGTNALSYWMTPQAGTGKWEEYIRVSNCGDSGTFSGGGHVYISGPVAAVTWYVASINVYDIQTSGTSAIQDAALTTNIPRKNATGTTWTASQSFDNLYLAWTTTGVGAPTAARSAGTRLVFYPLAPSTIEYAQGVESGNMWFASGGGFKWYPATGTVQMTLTTGGALTVVGAVTGASLVASGTGGFTIGNVSATNRLYWNSTQFELVNSSNAFTNLQLATLTASGQVITPNVATASSGTALVLANGGTTVATISTSSATFTPRVIGPSQLYGRDVASFMAGSAAGNALIWGHADSQYRSAIGALPQLGYPSLMFYSYLGGSSAADTEYRSGANTMPARLHVNINGVLAYHTGPQNGTADTAITWTERFKVDGSGVVTALGNVNAAAFGSAATVVLFNTQSRLAILSGPTDFAVRNSANNADNFVVADSTGNMTARGTGTATDFILSSDRRLKQDLRGITNALDRLDAITGYTFHYSKDPTRRRVGVIAQDVQGVLPEAVVEVDGLLSVSYDSLIPVVIEAIKELRAALKRIRQAA